jgi:Zn finger protein HypA/HybF involved in hydrogenase expression
MTCSEFKFSRDLSRDLKEQKLDSMIVEELKSGLMQFCPKCHTPTNRIDGCNKMICTNRKCGTYWCWACGLGDLHERYYQPYYHYSESTGRDGTQVRCPAAIDAFSDIDKARELIAKRNQKLLEKNVYINRLAVCIIFFVTALL